MKTSRFGLQSIRPIFFRAAQGDVLEIGPLDRPVIRRAKYFDVLPTPQLQEYAAKVGRKPEGVPEIDYYSAGGDLAVVPEKFDAVVSCHCIEHQPDIIRHLSQVRGLLRPGGRYLMVVPDRRYCFDHFRRESTVDDMRAARGRTLHSLETLIEHSTEVTHNNALLHWIGIHGREMGAAERELRISDVKKKFDTGEYIDAHAWKFTPDSFAKSVAQLEPETGLSVIRVNGTIPGMQEFTAVLTPS